MTVNEATALAARLESLVRRIYIFDKTRDDVADEITFIVNDLREYADRLDRAMERELMCDEAA